MPQITVTAKVTGFHPASGLYLVEGEEYSIAEETFAADVFQLKIQNQESKIITTIGRDE